MKDIDEMNYFELLALEESIKNAKSRYYRADELWVVYDHFCTRHVVGNYSFSGDHTVVDYSDVFTKEKIERYNIFASVPHLIDVLHANNIPYKDFMKLEELKEVWEQYKNRAKVYKK